MIDKLNLLNKIFFFYKIKIYKLNKNIIFYL